MQSAMNAENFMLCEFVLEKGLENMYFGVLKIEMADFPNGIIDFGSLCLSKWWKNRHSFEPLWY